MGRAPQLARVAGPAVRMRPCSRLRSRTVRPMVFHCLKSSMISWCRTPGRRQGLQTLQASRPRRRASTRSNDEVALPLVDGQLWRWNFSPVLVT